MHTPGPWKGYGHTGYVYGPDVVVCRCGDYQDKELLPYNKDRWAADAHLIAAAPDLHETLKRMVNAWAPKPPGTDYDTWIEAKAALAKARGETA